MHTDEGVAGDESDDDEGDGTDGEGDAVNDSSKPMAVLAIMIPIGNTITLSWTKMRMMVAMTKMLAMTAMAVQAAANMAMGWHGGACDWRLEGAVGMRMARPFTAVAVVAC